MRFAYCFLESLFRRVRDDGFSSEKALVVLGCSQIAAAFSVANALLLAGARRTPLDFGAAVAMGIGLLVVVFNYVVISGGGGLDGYRRAYEELPAGRRAWGGAVVIIFSVAAVVGCIVTGSMVANLSRH